jgi:uncharacterized membrane protein
LDLLFELCIDRGTQADLVLFADLALVGDIFSFDIEGRLPIGFVAQLCVFIFSGYAKLGN